MVSFVRISGINQRSRDADPKPEMKMQMKTFSPYSCRLTPFASHASFDSLDKQLETLFAGLPSLFELSGFDAKSNGASAPAVRWYESDDAYLAQIDLPGVRPADLEIETLGGELTVSAERVFGREGKDETGENRRSYRKTLRLPEGVEEDRISARYENGVLSLTAPKGEKVKPRRVEIN